MTETFVSSIITHKIVEDRTLKIMDISSAKRTLKINAQKQIAPTLITKFNNSIIQADTRANSAKNIISLEKML